LKQLPPAGVWLEGQDVTHWLLLQTLMFSIVPS